MFPPFIHVGLPKTGTTFLQKQVFPAFRRLRFLNAEIYDKLKQIEFQEDAAFDPESLREYFEPLMTGPTLISQESLCGDAFNLFVNQARTADRLSQVFPEATIILSIRRQDALLTSIYCQLLREGGAADLHDFLGYRDGAFVPNHHPLPSADT